MLKGTLLVTYLVPYLFSLAHRFLNAKLCKNSVNIIREKRWNKNVKINKKSLVLIISYIILFELCKEKLGVDKLPGAERVNLNTKPESQFECISSLCAHYFGLGFIYRFIVYLYQFLKQNSLLMLLICISIACVAGGLGNNAKKVEIPSI